MNLKLIVVIVLLLQALALPVAALADPPTPEPTRGVHQGGAIASPAWNYGMCYYSQNSGDIFYFWLYNPAFVGIFFTKEASDVATLSHQCGQAHWIALYCPDGTCDWTAIFTYSYGYWGGN